MKKKLAVALIFTLLSGAGLAATTSIVVADTLKKDSWSITLKGDAFDSLHIVNLGVNIDQFTWKLFPDTYFGPTSPPFFAERDSSNNVISFYAVNRESGEDSPTFVLNKRFVVLSSVNHESFTLESKNIEVDYRGGTQWYPTTPVPEPETYGMLMAGLGIVGLMAKCRKEKSAV